jgi:hypothetical protein
MEIEELKAKIVIVTFFVICISTLLKIRRIPHLIWISFLSLMAIFFYIALPLGFLISFIWITNLFIYPVNLNKTGKYLIIFSPIIAATLYFFYYIYQEVLKNYYYSDTESRKNLINEIFNVASEIIGNFFSTVFYFIKTGGIPEYGQAYINGGGKDEYAIALEFRNIYLSQNLKVFYFIGFILFQILCFCVFLEQWLLNDAPSFIQDYYYIFDLQYAWYQKFSIYSLMLIFFSYLYGKLYEAIDIFKLNKIKRIYSSILSQGHDVEVRRENTKDGFFSLTLVRPLKDDWHHELDCSKKDDDLIYRIEHKSFTLMHKPNESPLNLSILLQPKLLNFNVKELFYFLKEIELLYGKGIKEDRDWIKFCRFILKNRSSH